MNPAATNRFSEVVGTWSHSRGGIVSIDLHGDAVLVIDNPHTNQPPAAVPGASFLQPDGRLCYFNHTGTLSGDTISWSNGSTWSKAAMRYFVVRGRVQNVMFRQTLVRALQSRGLQGGATNHKLDSSRADLTLFGPSETVNQLVAILATGTLLNSWGAQAQSVEEVETGCSIQTHQVNTDNVNDFRWNLDVVMYI